VRPPKFKPRTAVLTQACEKVIGGKRVCYYATRILAEVV